MTLPRTLSRHLTPSLFISLLALVVATSSGAYAMSTLRAGEVHTRHLATGAVTSAKVKDFSLRLNDLGGRGQLRTVTTVRPLDIPGGECRRAFLDGDNPAPAGVLGSLVVGYVTDADGHAVLSDSGVVLPTMVTESTQDGITINLVVCAGIDESIPTGSIFHFQLIGPGKS